MHWLFNISLKNSLLVLDRSTRNILEYEANGIRETLERSDSDILGSHDTKTLLNHLLTTIEDQILKHPKVTKAPPVNELEMQIAQLTSENTQLKQKIKDFEEANKLLSDELLAKKPKV